MEYTTVKKFLPVLLWCSVTLMFGSVNSCADSDLNCEWFCDQELPLVNRTETGSFQTEFLTAAKYRTLAYATSVQHSIFVTPGVEYHCLELAVRCAATQEHQERKRVLQLVFRCDHFTVTYLAIHGTSGTCYRLHTDQMNHHVRNPRAGCLRFTFSQGYHLVGDGHLFMLVLLCHGIVSKRQSGNVAYWLFVNKCNTPQQNREIYRQLSRQYTGALEVDGTWSDGSTVGDRDVCRCDIFERYILAVKRCNKPFLPTGMVSKGQRPARLHPTDDLFKVHKVSTSVYLSAKERMRWFVVKGLIVFTILVMVLYILFQQLKQHTEETLTHE